MSRQTINYNLTKPDYTDTADIEVINSNMDIVDNTLKVIDTKAQNVMSKNSSPWSSTTTYTVGQYCIYNNSLWKCLVQHSGQTPQEGTYWTKVSLDTLGAEISAINSNLTFKNISDGVPYNITRSGNTVIFVFSGMETKTGTSYRDYLTDLNIPKMNAFAPMININTGELIYVIMNGSGIITVASVKGIPINDNVKLVGQICWNI